MSDGDQNMSNENTRQVMPAQVLAVTEYQGNEPGTASATVGPSVPTQRHPQTLQDVLRYTIEASAGRNNPNVAGTQMDVERRTFLEASLHAFTSSTVDRMSACIQLLLSDDIQQDESSCEEALEQIIDLVDNIDNAKDFYKIGGFRIIPVGLHSTHGSIRALTANLLAELSQNNTYIQDQVLETEFLSLLLSMVASDPDPTVQVKSFYAVSCIVRDHEAALKMFSQQQGWSVVLKSLQSSMEKLQLKACFFVSSVCTQTPSVIAELCELGCVEQLCGLLAGATQCPLTEHLLQALLAMATNSKNVIEMCSLPQLQVRTTLSNILASSEKDTDEFTYAQQIKILVFGTNYEDDGER